LIPESKEVKLNAFSVEKGNHENMLKISHQKVSSYHLLMWHCTDCNKNSLELFSRPFEESPAWFCSHLFAMIRACTYHSAMLVKPQQWPTPSESIAIYCLRKLVSCITHLQSCAKSRLMKQKKKITHCC